tara:strand:- start:1045 stop:2481 length:1437 start_codon:yes stop_codon:yes gene_type:complete
MGRGSSGSAQQTIVRDLPEEAKPFLYGFGDQFLTQEEYDELSPEEQANIDVIEEDGSTKYRNPDYIEGLLPTAQKLFTGQLPEYGIADRDPLQDLAYTLTQSGVGSYQPYLDAASNAQFLGMQGVGQAMDETQRLAGEIPGQVAIGQQALGEGITKADIAAERARMSTSAAQQALMDAGQFGRGTAGQGIASLRGAASQFDPRMSAAYYNPFETQAVDAALADIERAGARQLDEVGRQTRDQALRQGAFSGNRRFLEQFRREDPIREDILERQARTAAGMRQAGYEAAAERARQSFEQARARQLQSAQTIGQLGQAGAGTQITAADRAGQLGLGAEQLAQTSAIQGGQLGSQAAQLGLQGINTGLGAQQQIAGMGQGIAGLGMNMANLGGMQQRMGAADINLLSQMGAQGQGYQQSLLDAQRANQMLPYQQVGFFSDVIQGAPLGTAQTTFAPTASPFQRFTGNAITYAGLQNAGVFG